MCKFFKPQSFNHHFPELKKKHQLKQLVVGFFTGKRVAALLAVLILVLGFSYLTQTNKTVTKGYQIRELEQKLDQLQEKNEKLNLEYIELQSMANITKQVSNMNLVAEGQVEIISSLGSQVALR